MGQKSDQTLSAEMVPVLEDASTPRFQLASRSHSRWCLKSHHCAMTVSPVLVLGLPWLLLPTRARQEVSRKFGAERSGPQVTEEISSRDGEARCNERGSQTNSTTSQLCSVVANTPPCIPPKKRNAKSILDDTKRGTLHETLG